MLCEKPLCLSHGNIESIRKNIIKYIFTFIKNKHSDKSISVKDKSIFLSSIWLSLDSSIIIDINVIIELNSKLLFILRDTKNIEKFIMYIAIFSIIFETFCFKNIVEIVELDSSKSGSIENIAPIIMLNKETGILNSIQAWIVLKIPIVQ